MPLSAIPSMPFLEAIEKKQHFDTSLLIGLKVIFEVNE
jgi:hypothetical protein